MDEKLAETGSISISTRIFAMTHIFIPEEYLIQLYAIFDFLSELMLSLYIIELNGSFYAWN